MVLQQHITYHKLEIIKKFIWNFKEVAGVASKHMNQHYKVVIIEAFHF
jgi:hypothetical protein